MRACLVFGPPTDALPVARWALETVASLMEVEWRATTLGADVSAEEAIVYCGDPARAPADAAVIVPVGAWEAWDPATLEVATIDGDPVPCPRGDLGAAADERALPALWLRAIAHLLAREEEVADTRRDQWQCYSGAYTRLSALDVLDVPIVNRCARQLERHLVRWAESRGRKLAPRPRWPRGARFAAVLSHDVDDISLHSLPAALRLLGRARGPRSYAIRAGLTKIAHRLFASGPDPYWNFDRWAKAEDEHGFRSTFYFTPPHPRRPHEYDALYHMKDVVGFEGRRMPLAEMVKTLAERGFEVGLHGSYNSYRTGMALADEKRQIERATGLTLAGIRQHFLRFDVRTTWREQVEAGFTHDSTLGYNEAIGFRAGIAAPFQPWSADAAKPHALLELPLTLMDGTLFRTLGLHGQAAARRTLEHLDRVEEAGGLAVLLWHPNAAAEAQFPGWWLAYLVAIDHLAKRGAWVATAGEVAAWWRERARAAVPA